MMRVSTDIAEAHFSHHPSKYLRSDLALESLWNIANRFSNGGTRGDLLVADAYPSLPTNEQSTLAIATCSAASDSRVHRQSSRADKRAKKQQAFGQPWSAANQDAFSHFL
jgi:hypothetical protein